MLDFSSPAPYVVALLVGMLAYFLKDAHTNIKIGLEQRATQKALEDAKSEWRADQRTTQKAMEDAKAASRADMRDIQERHQRETSRLEQQYDQKFAAVVNQFQERMDSVEKNLQGRMDLILQLLQKNRA
jgi:hypothetical protein